MNVIPAIDMQNGHCVRLFQGDFARETRYADAPAAIAARYAAMGFRQLHLVDLDGARSGTQHNRKLVRSIVSASSLDVQLGGGIRDRDTVVRWFDDGVQRVVIGSLAVTDAAEVRAWLAEFGAERIVLALDCRLDDAGSPRIATHGWTRDSTLSLWHCVDGFLDAGLQHVLCTDVSRDGTLAGPSTALYRDFRARYPKLSLQASGGVRHVGDLAELRRLGAAGAITGRALLDGRISPDEVTSFLRGA